MIQQTNREARGPPASPPAVPDTETTAASDGPEIWGKWSGRKHYSLEVVQHPLRARMCGFGDKDRRPLAPAAVAKMVVRNHDNSIVDVDEIDWSFFLVTVDLWSADGKQEMNLVLHPSSADRYMTIPPSKNRRRGTSINQPHSGHQTPIQPSPAPSYRPPEPTPQTPLPTYTAHHQGYFASTTSADNSYTGSGHPPGPQQQDHGPSWGYASAGVDRSTTYPPPILPSIHTFAAVTPTSTSQTHTWENGDAYHHQHHHQIDPNDSKNPSQPGHDSNTIYASAPYVHQQHPQQHQSIQLSPSNSQQSQSHSATTTGYAVPPYASTPNTGPSGANFSTTSPNNNNNPANSNSSNIATPAVNLQADARTAAANLAANSNPGTTAPTTTSYPPMPSPRLAYTRTLVGPLSANACRLQDEHRKPGIFFLFQDLSVRTEGTFRLRMRLMNVGAPPAPEYGATKVHTDVSPVLAQVFTEAFTVFSAKRFPGVPDTTALSIAFGNQGQKIPLRNRHGPAKRRRRDSSSAEEEEDSDEAE
ncbi:hypothetical protein P691DRAFT_801059 [Macrolepiota fuliginosa MF-IS2]|uniref:Velvet domain-containing protein n=1 Tax=Macrolepiota fuliginosa MF-IS2 TaxID=1400762 RepID=A0A9P6C1X1_9AGAR|nr:hypothetical protein P691DRAFT_801059 [Macrolepiota fuliginosa MF-IS2]